MLQYQTATFHVGHNLIEEDTRNQAAGSQFFITELGGSELQLVRELAIQIQLNHLSLIKTIYPNISKFSTAAIEYRCKDESLALKAYESIMKQSI